MSLPNQGANSDSMCDVLTKVLPLSTTDLNKKVSSPGAAAAGCKGGVFCGANLGKAGGVFAFKDGSFCSCCIN